ncbi:MAG: hypothetical protein M0C28_07855 [Candidatus Moduliflexus flocculans]|nr:hypothetical protein [Candidatus Moduliflexus flocculans]
MCTGEKKCMPDDAAPGAAPPRRSAADGERRGVGREDARRGGDRLDLAQHLLLQRQVLEDRLDHQVGVGGSRE